MQPGRHTTHFLHSSTTQSTASRQLNFIDAVPPEILGQIFLDCLPREARGVSFTDAPLLLLQVCRSWRQIALQTPYLWTSLDFTFPFNLDGRSIFQLWLEKAGALPIKVVFDTNDYRPKPTEAGLMWLLLRNFERISSLSGVLGTRFADELMSSMLPIQGGNLTMWNVRDETGLDEDHMLTVEASIHVPQLRHFRMAGPWFLMPVLSFTPSLLQSFSLTRVEFEFPALPSLELIHLLGQCSDLKTLEFTVCEETIPDSLLESDALVLTRLQCLILHVVFESAGTFMFLRTLQIPNVEHIQVRPEHDSVTYCRARWADALFRQPLPQLRSLILEKVNFSIRDPTEAPQSDSFLTLTSLECLQFEYCVLDRDTIDALLPSQDSTQSPLPRLFRLNIIGGDMDWSAMTRLVSSRAVRRTSSGWVGCLQHFAVGYPCPPPTPSDRRTLEQLVSMSNGMFHFFVPEP